MRLGRRCLFGNKRYAGAVSSSQRCVVASSSGDNHFGRREFVAVGCARYTSRRVRPSTSSGSVTRPGSG